MEISGVLLWEDVLEEYVGDNRTIKSIIEKLRKNFITLWVSPFSIIKIKELKKKIVLDGINVLLLVKSDFEDEFPEIRAIKRYEKSPVILSYKKEFPIASLTPEEILSYEFDIEDITLLDLKREVSYFDFSEVLLKAFHSGNWISASQSFEEEMKRFFGNEFFVLGVNSGTDALTISLLSLKNLGYFSDGDEIITTSLTFNATAQAIARVGATPVFADIDEEFNISPESIKKSITKKTKGIVVVHLYGLPAEMRKITEIAREYGFFIVEDCAQSFGAKYNSKLVGTIGDVGCFSFFPSKNLGGFGDGGMIITKNKNIYEIAKAIATQGSRKRDYPEFIGMNSRLDTIQSELLKEKIKYIHFLNERRREIAKTYTEILSKKVITPRERENSYHVFHQYTIRTQKRDELMNYLKKNKIETRIYYPYPIHQTPIFSKVGKTYDKMEKVEKYVKEILSLPIEPLYQNQIIKKIAEKILNFLR